MLLNVFVLFVRLFDHAFRTKAVGAWHYKVIIPDMIDLINHHAYNALAKD